MASNQLNEVSHPNIGKFYWVVSDVSTGVEDVKQGIAPTFDAAKEAIAETCDKKGRDISTLFCVIMKVKATFEYQ